MLFLIIICSAKMAIKTIKGAKSMAPVYGMRRLIGPYKGSNTWFMPRQI